MYSTDEILKIKKTKGFSWNKLAENLPVTGEALRVSFVRNSVDEEYLKEIYKVLNVNAEYRTKDLDQNMLNEPTGFYYPEVSAAAGMDKEIVNDELKRIPINLPNWEKGIDFINVYGDSMYPKYCSGEIIGIKEVELQYLNFGYAYVVILKDGQVMLKFIKKGSNSEHIILESENKFYEPKEYHLDQIKKVFIIKGVISKTTM